MDDLVIENVVASSSMERNLDLWKIADALEDSQYDPDDFPGLIYRFEDPKTAILLFESGKVVCTGGKTIKEAEKSVNKMKELLNENGIETAETVETTVQNMVASYELGTNLNLSSVAITLGLERVEYEPEQFPGLVYRVPDSEIVLLVFGSGRMVCTGGKNEQNLVEGVKHIEKELKGAALMT